MPRYGALRSVLIMIGVTAFAFLWSQRQPLGYVVAGVALQLLLTAAHAAIKEGQSSQARMLVELVGDGITVLLFALGVLGNVVSSLDV